MIADIIHTTRRSAERALNRQQVNGLGVRVQGVVVFRYARDGYKVVTVGDVACERDRFFTTTAEVLAALFRGGRS